jgi:NOL1/NOP2/fmu family ribosome biogenesis protein
MKTNLRALSGRDIKPVLALIKDQWGAAVDFPWAWYQSTKNDLFVVSKDIVKIDARMLNINSVGLYLGEIKHGELRLSIEGSQLIGPHAAKNIVELNEKELRQWLRGEDLVKDVSATGFVIMKSSEDFVGCGKVKEGRILNFVPKARRLLVKE